MRRRMLRAFAARPSAVVGAVIILLFTLIAVFAPLVSPYDPLKQNLPEMLQAPSLSHPLGTDSFGRDLLSRIVWGSRVSLRVGLLSVLLGSLIGIGLGLVSGYFGRTLDTVVMRVIDIGMAFPMLLLAISIVAFFGTGLTNLILAIGIANIPEFTRLTRGEVLRVRTVDYVVAGEALGAKSGRIMLRHILPNLTGTIVVMATLRISVAVLTESSLSFLGLGIPAPTPSWGVMLAEGQKLLILAPWASIFPGLAIALLVMGFNLMGDGLRDVYDPRTMSESLLERQGG